MERQYNTLDLLKAHPEVAKFVDWIKTKPSAFKPVSSPAKIRGRKR